MRAARLRGTEFVGMAGGALLVLGLIAYNGFVDRPGEIEISLRLGLLAALVATLVIVGAAATRSSESERPRKPPGTT